MWLKVKKFFIWLKGLFLYKKKLVVQEPFVKTIRIKLSGGIANAELVRKNVKTVWVRLLDGYIIKRHKIRHII